MNDQNIPAPALAPAPTLKPFHSLVSIVLSFLVIFIIEITKYLPWKRTVGADASAGLGRG